MEYRSVFNLLGRYFFYFAFLLLIPFVVSFFFEYYHETEHPQPHSTFAFLLSFIVCLLFSGTLKFLGRGSDGRLHRKESILVVVLIWVVSPAVSALPFMFSGTLESPLQAYFECVSGFSTTGATIMAPKKYDKEGHEEKITVTVPGERTTRYHFWGNITPVRDRSGKILSHGIEAVSKGVLFWRSLIQWLGGMGIVVLFIAVLPGLGIGGKQLASSEMPGPMETSLAPRVVETASILWKVYLFFTVLQVVLLMVTNAEMPCFDAITIALTTLSTGGFSVRNTSIGFYQNGMTEWIVIIFMVIGSINFALWFYIIKGKIYRAFEKELLIYFCVIVISSLFGAYFISGTPRQLLTGEMAGVFTPFEALRASAFQMISANSSSGFATVNFEIWPYSAQTFMLMLMFIGGMAGSTSGGIKILRNYILFKTAQYKIESVFRPETVRAMYTCHRQITQDTSMKALIFFLLMIGISAASTVLFIMDGVDPESALSVVASTVNNAGFGFRAFGPMESCAFLSEFGMLLSCFLMIAGRLEFFVLMTVLTPSFWKKNT